ncbi:FadR/GntR family transcriptional regulator [Profundibacter sp.]|uniref:FadR/GntR family transcriptional regulator n=1 Tax=Profundibacter sp. TaxID=3101071 RepID=UPI003D0F52B5
MDQKVNMKAQLKRPRVGKGFTGVLGRDICTGTFPVGTVLPSESELCNRYGVSRTVVRETLNVFESKGLISRKARVGTTVNPQDEWNILDEQVLRWLGDGIRDTNILFSVLEARRLIEPVAAEKAAERASMSEVAALESAWQGMVDGRDDRAAFVEADVEFHKILLKASHNRVFHQLGASFQAAIHMVLETSGQAAENLDDAIATHGKLVEALRIRDSVLARETVTKMLELSARDLALAEKKNDN